MTTTPQLHKSEAIDQDENHLWIDGRRYRVTRLPAARQIDTYKVKPKSTKDPLEKLRQQSPHDQRKSIIKILTKEKEDAVREEVGGKLTVALREEYTNELAVSEEEIAKKIWELNT